MADVWANSMACHPRATCHIAGCCHLANSMSWSQSYVSHCRVLPLGEVTVMIPHDSTCHIAGCSHLAKSMSWSCRVAGCNNSFRHIENRFSTYFIFFCFLMQFGLWQTAAFVSSPIHLLYQWRYTVMRARLNYSKCISYILISTNILSQYLIFPWATAIARRLKRTRSIQVLHDWRSVCGESWSIRLLSLRKSFYSKLVISCPRLRENAMRWDSDYCILASLARMLLVSSRLRQN